MPKFSVKKPLTVFVAVIAILVLGVVAYLDMVPDLLPNMDFPYVMIMTTYPGASPEKVESEVTRPLEQSMSTLEHIVEVTSTSSENYSMVMLEFEESVNMDTIGVDIQQAISTLQSGWDDMVGTPYVLKINPSMLPVEVAALSMEGMTTIELTDFLNKTLMNKLEGIPGVARITTSGLVTQQLHVVLDQEKIDSLNQQIADIINKQMDEASAELNAQLEELRSAQTQLEDAKAQLEAGKEELAGQTAQGEAELNYQQGQLVATKAQLQDQIIQLQSGKTQLETTLSVLKAIQSGLDGLGEQSELLQAQVKVMLDLQKRAEELVKLRTQFDDQIAAIENDPVLTPEQKEAAIAELKASPAYVEMEAQWAALEAELGVLGLTLETLGPAIAENQELLESLRLQMEALLEALGGQGLDLSALDDQIAQLESSLSQIDLGIAALNSAISQVDSGMLQLKDAAALLSEQKTMGLLEISNAASEINSNSAMLTSALTQLESGLAQLEAARTDALAQADLNNILTMEMVSQLLTAQNFAMPAGYISQNGISYMVSVGEEITELEQMENLLLFDMGMEGLDPIYLPDVAAVMLVDNRDETYSKLNGENSITLQFEKQSTYATAETTNNIADRFRELEKEYPGLSFVSLMSQGDYIYLIVDSIMNSLLLGALFSVLILFLFLKDIRPTFITLCAIPISVIFAIVLMYFSGVTINMISLSGLAVAVGMLVDNSVVVIENIYRLRSKGANVIQAAVSGAAQVAGAVTSSTLTTVCVFLPIVFVEGITRQLFTDLALTMTYALMASLIVSLTLVPAMASGLLRKEKQQKETFMNSILGVYEVALRWSLNHKIIILAVSVVLLVATAWASLAGGFIFMPDMDMPSVNVTVSIPAGSTMAEAVELSDQVLERIDTLEGIETVGANMSASSASALGGETTYSVTLYITLSDENAKGSQVGKAIEEACADLPCTISSSSAMMDTSALTGGSGISLRIYAENMQTLQDAAREAATILYNVDGVADVSDGLEDAAPALHVNVDRNAAMAKGLTVAQIYMEIATALTESTTMPSLELGGTTTSLIIQKPEGAKLDVDGLKSYVFEVTGRDGTVTEIPLSDFATVEETTSLSSISRINQRRYLTVSATLEEGYNVTLVNTAAERALRDVDLGAGVSYQFTGENETIMEAVEQLLLMLLLGVLLVYLVMVAQFQSLKSPFIVMFTIPLAFTGGFLGLLICGMEVSVVALIGFVMLVGIIVNNGIVLVDYINQLRQEGMERREAIVDAGRTRMRPILMTTITTILGLINMATSQAAGTALMQPVAVVCIGGLTYATLMTLFVVPVIYDLLNRKELRTVREEDLKLLDI
ncbi:MAG: efflux RND transporter permease subunit [Oscillospiraceae bacterium]|nr:efflux RND transporter permease subunit [Oscillospiraceae bacterium]